MKELEILNKLSRLDLSSLPIDDVNRYINQIGPRAGIVYALHSGFPIFRARPNDSDSQEFISKAQISYKPEYLNTTFQRASIPNKTMFYGSVLPPETGEDDLDNARLTACLEASITYRNNLFKSNEKITFSRWEVQETVKVLIVLPGNSVDERDSFQNKMNDVLNQNMVSNRELSIRTKLVNEYFAKQFSNSNIRYNYDYLISALFTESRLKYGIDGILFPSVKASGKGYNICITPNAVDNKMKLISVGTGRILKIGYVSQVVNESQFLVTDENQPFVFEKTEDYVDPTVVIKNLENEYC